MSSCDKLSLDIFQIINFIMLANIKKVPINSQRSEYSRNVNLKEEFGVLIKHDDQI